MAFFRNRAVNWLNLHYGIQAIAFSGGAAFFIVYLLKAGIPVSGALLSIALILLGRFVIRPFVVIAAVRWGLRALVIAGTLLNALTYPLLAAVHGVGVTLLALIALSSVAGTLYWTAYHAWFAAVGDDEHRGHQVSVREAMAAIVSIAAPLLTGWLLVRFGPEVAFGATGLVTAIAALPLLRAPDIAVVRHVPGAFRAALPGIALFCADGWIGAANVFVWEIALFVSIDESYLGYGGAMALAALVGAVAGMTLGRHIDAGHGRRAVTYALSLFALVVALRAAASGHAALAVLANAAGAVGYCLYIPTLMTAVYTLAKRSPCTLRFHVATEGGWDFGGASGLLVAALASWLHVPLGTTILLALAGVAAMAILLRRFYGGAAGGGRVWRMSEY